MQKNKFTTYLLYAIGEIFLVVIGILIAVSINNWNSKRTLLASAHINLKILKQNLYKDLSQLYSLKELAARNVGYSDTLLSQFKRVRDVDVNTSRYLATLIMEFNFKPTKIGFNALDNSGEIAVLSDSLQRLILTYYASVDDIIERDNISNAFIRDKYEELIFERTDIYNRMNTWPIVQEFYKDDLREAIPINADKFLEDKVLENHIIARWYQSRTQIQMYDKAIEALNDVLNALENE